MIAALLLLVFAASAATLGRRALLRADFPRRSPTWGIRAWCALAFCVVSAILLAAVVVAIPYLPIDLPEEHTHLTAEALADHYATPSGAWLPMLALAAGALVLGRLAACLVSGLLQGRRVRREQRAALALVGLPHADGYTVVPHERPLVYALPGRGRQIVVTTAARDLLGASELGAVLAHERAHLRHRHDVLVAVTHACARAFGGWPVLRDAHRQVAALAEMQADDAARSDRLGLARALVVLSVAGAPAADRVRRLGDSLPLGAAQSGAVGALVLLVVCSPLVLAASPALEALIHRCT